MLSKRDRLEDLEFLHNDFLISNDQIDIKHLIELKKRYENFRKQKYGKYAQIEGYFFPQSEKQTDENGLAEACSNEQTIPQKNGIYQYSSSVFEYLNSDLSISSGNWKKPKNNLPKIGFHIDLLHDSRYNPANGKPPIMSITYNSINNTEKNQKEGEKNQKNIVQVQKRNQETKNLGKDQTAPLPKQKKGEFNIISTPRMSVFERKRIKVSIEDTCNNLSETKTKNTDRRNQLKTKLTAMTNEQAGSFKIKLVDDKYDEVITSVIKNQKFFQRIDYEGNLLKLATLASKIIKKSMVKSKKTNKEFAFRAKKLHREMLVYWKRKNKEMNELRKKKEKLEIEMKKKEEERAEQVNQMKRIEYLITQSAFYAQIMASKIGTQTENEVVNDQLIKLNDDETKNAQNSVLDIIRKNKQRVHEIDVNQQKLNLCHQKGLQDGNLGGPVITQQLFDKSSFDFSNVNLTDESKLLTVPSHFKGVLTEYQLKGLRWLDNLYEQGINGILADEMGLGKTIQALALLAHISERKDNWGPFLVIAPSTTLFNWHTETQRFAPHLKVLPYWGSLKQRKHLRRYMQQHYLGKRESNFNIVITSYQIAVLDEKILQRLTWSYIILDEAQAIKNIKGQRWNTLLSLKSRNKLLLTGTPIQNTMAELWALLHFIMPKLFDSHEQFQEWFSKDIEAHSQNKQELNKTQLNRLHAILKPFMLRRVKKDVEKEIGQKHEYEIFCKLTVRQQIFYDKIKDKICISDLFSLRENKEKVKNLMNLVMQFRKVCNHPDLFERKMVRSGFVFSKEIFAYKAPSYLYDKDFTMVWYNEFQNPFCERLPVDIENLHEETFKPRLISHLMLDKYQEFFNFTGESILIFDFWYKLDIQSLIKVLCNWHYLNKYSKKPRQNTSLITKLEKYQKQFCNEVYETFFYLENSVMNLTSLFIEKVIAVPPKMISTKKKLDYSTRFWKIVDVLTPKMEFPTFISLILDSSKLIYLDSLLLKLKCENKRCLIFCQMTKMMDILEEFLQWRQYHYFRLDGTCNLSSRRDMVREYQRNPEIFVFLLSTRAGGLGVTLTAADVVIFYDNDWNPTMDAQAADRAHRIGRTKDVDVYRLITKNTIEDKIVKRAHQKKTVQQTVYSGEAFKGNVFKTNDIISILFDEKEINQRKELKNKISLHHTKRTGKDAHHDNHKEDAHVHPKKQVQGELVDANNLNLAMFDQDFELDFGKNLDKLLGSDFE